MAHHEKLSTIWHYYKPRHTHSWNMLVIAFQHLGQVQSEAEPFEAEYAWENVILRLWLYRVVVQTLTKLDPVKEKAEEVLRLFDQTFDQKGINNLKALRDMIEHFDDYAAGHGRGAANRGRDLDPWRAITRDEYNRGQFTLLRKDSLLAAVRMRKNAKEVSDDFIAWYHNQ